MSSTTSESRNTEVLSGTGITISMNYYAKKVTDINQQANEKQIIETTAKRSTVEEFATGVRYDGIILKIFLVNRDEGWAYFLPYCRQYGQRWH